MGNHTIDCKFCGEDTRLMGTFNGCETEKEAANCYNNRLSRSETLKMIFDSTGAPLPCYGCAHSIGGAAYPSGPSGERPCLFCIRHPDQDKRTQDLARIRSVHPAHTARYDNGPTRKDIADQYIATDRLLRDIPDGTMVIT